MPARTGVLIYAPFFHRDDERLPFADRFAPALWLDRQDAEQWPLVPFSAGPAECPGRNLVLLLGSALLAAIGREQRGHLRALRPQARPRLPGTLNYFTTEFTIGTSD